MIDLVGIAVANFGFIFLKAFQQRNVAYDNHYLIIPTSFVMAIVEVYVIAQIAINGFSVPLVAAVGVGGGTGALCAALAHKRWFLKEEHKR